MKLLIKSLNHVFACLYGSWTVLSRDLSVYFPKELHSFAMLDAFWLTNLALKKFHEMNIHCLNSLGTKTNRIYAFNYASERLQKI